LAFTVESLWQAQVLSHSAGIPPWHMNHLLFIALFIVSEVYLLSHTQIALRAKKTSKKVYVTMQSLCILHWSFSGVPGAAHMVL